MQVLILAGGRGKRFWPLSRRSQPKQLLELDDDSSLLQRTCERLSGLVEHDDIWICTTADLADQIRSQLPDVPHSNILCEPVGRNTAPAIGLALLSMPEASVVAVLPADHRVGDAARFAKTLATAANIVATTRNRVLTLGVQPLRAETGYGYLELGEVLDPETDLRRVECFREKPDLETALRYLKNGKHLWNAGIFVFERETMLRHLAELEPEIGRGLEQIAAEPDRVDELYRRLPSVSIDYAVMERLRDLGTLPLDCGWSDLGSWQALGEVLPTDARANCIKGDVVAVEASNNLLFADHGTIAVLGIEDLTVVRTADTVLVLPTARSQEVRNLIEVLEKQRREELL